MDAFADPDALVRSYQIICLKPLLKFVCSRQAKTVPPPRGKHVADLEHQGHGPHMILTVQLRRVQIEGMLVKAYHESVSETLASLLTKVRACTACADALPLGPRPILQLSASATILVASQAPGSKAHQSGVPFSDASGDRLREWMGLSGDEFYDETSVAIVPMGFCYPGRLHGGDAPPRMECAHLWRDQLLQLLPEVRLTLLVGSHAQQHVLGPGAITPRVRNFRDYLPAYFPLPHPSWRSRIWEERNRWFREDVVPALRSAIGRARFGHQEHDSVR